MNAPWEVKIAIRAQTPSAPADIQNQTRCTRSVNLQPPINGSVATSIIAVPIANCQVLSLRTVFPQSTSVWLFPTSPTAISPGPIARVEVATAKKATERNTATAMQKLEITPTRGCRTRLTSM